MFMLTALVHIIGYGKLGLRWRRENKTMESEVGGRSAAGSLLGELGKMAGATRAI